ncbi:MAG: 1A family penicillin-binding protein [uncultured bacterium]|nr:MAG: 1A family penicillin-binding protein [uncultured bacterium]
MKDYLKKIGFILKVLFRETIMISLYVSIMLAVLGASFFLYLMTKTPLGTTLYTRHIPQTSIIYDRTGEHILYEVHGEENRKILSHDEIPDSVRIATVATEDDSFYSHHGIDIMGIFRALKVNIEQKGIYQGGSTITQQLARNVFLNRDRTIKRKILEAVYAIKIERKYTKDEILDAYLNEVPYGSNAYGIEAAAETYFGKSAKELTLDESALLASMTKATSYYSPYGNHTKELVSRQKWVLARTASLGFEDTEKVDLALKENTFEKIVPFQQPIQAPHFVFYVLDQLRKEYGEQTIEEGGFKIYTTLDLDKQRLAEQIIRESSDYNLKRYGATNAALVAIDPKTGQILTMVGSKDYFNSSIDGQVNVTIRPRQPGSSFKPFVYAKAFEKGFQPETFVLDGPTNFGPDGGGRNYVPRNYSGRFHGVISIRQALAMSLNVPAVKTLREVGIDEAIEMAHRLGITTLNDRNRYGLSLVIGGGEVTLLDETSGFSVFANDGKRNPVDPILKIVDKDNKIIRENSPKNMPVLDPQIARKINSILSDNKSRTPIFGPNNKLFIPGRTVAAKTGTTQEFRDAWTVGFTPHIAVGVWAGNNNNRSMRPGADGSFVAAPIWNKFMSQVLPQYPDDTFLAYEKSDSKAVPKVAAKSQYKITYYRKSNKKKISEKKAKSMKPEKVIQKIEVVSSEPFSAEGNFIDKKPVF